jgi:hypothetical protein
VTRPTRPLALVVLAVSLIGPLTGAIVNAGPDQPQQPSASGGPLWMDVTIEAIGRTKHWTNKVEIADLDGNGRPDLLFANGGDYSTPGAPEPNQVFLNIGPGLRFREATEAALGPTPDLARVIKARDLNGDGLTDVVVGTTYQTQSRCSWEPVKALPVTRTRARAAAQRRRSRARRGRGPISTWYWPTGALATTCPTTAAGRGFG